MILYNDSDNNRHRLFNITQSNGIFRVRNIARWFPDTGTPEFTAWWHGQVYKFTDRIYMEPSFLDPYGIRVGIGSVHFEPSLADNFAKMPKAGDYYNDGTIYGFNCWVKSSRPSTVGIEADIMPGANFSDGDGHNLTFCTVPPVKLENTFSTTHPEYDGFVLNSEDDTYYNGSLIFSSGIGISAWFLIQAHNLAGVKGMHCDLTVDMFGHSSTPGTHDISITADAKIILENGSDGWYLVKTANAFVVPTDGYSDQFSKRVKGIKRLRQPSLKLALFSGGYVNFYGWGFEMFTLNNGSPPT